MTVAMQGATQPHPSAAPSAGALHMIKLCVGVESVEELAHWQAERVAAREKRGADPRPYHVTRMTPRRLNELLDGGSLYWVIRGMVRARQRIDAVEPVEGDDGVTSCKLLFEPELIAVEAQPRRPFQGWRYLTGADAPRDLPQWRRDLAASAMPPELEEALAAYGVL